MAGRELRGDLFLLFTSFVRWQVRMIVCVGVLAVRIRPWLCIQRIDGAFEPDNNKGKCYT